jgi:hypothetical protein
VKVAAALNWRHYLKNVNREKNIFRIVTIQERRISLMMPASTKTILAVIPRQKMSQQRTVTIRGVWKIPLTWWLKTKPNKTRKIST